MHVSCGNTLTEQGIVFLSFNMTHHSVPFNIPNKSNPLLLNVWSSMIFHEATVTGSSIFLGLYNGHLFSLYTNIWGWFWVNLDSFFPPEDVGIKKLNYYGEFMATVHSLPGRWPCTLLRHIRVSTRLHQSLSLLEQYHQIPSERKSETSINSL